jgi:hypothetical protein
MRRGALVLVLLLVAALAGACSDESTSSGMTTATLEGGGEPADAATSTSAEDAVAAAAASTQGEGGANVSFVVEFEGGETAGRLTGEGAFADRRGRLTLDMSGLAGGGIVPGGADVELVFDELVYYMKFPPELAASLPGGKEWIKMDLAKLGASQGIDLEALAQINQSDPSQALAFLAGASDFESVGEEDVRGVATTHYRGTVDLEKVAESSSGPAGDAYRRLLELGGERTLPMDVWIDGESLVRRIRFSQKLPDGSGMTMTEELYDFGTEVDAEPPPESAVLDLTDLIGSP